MAPGSGGQSAASVVARLLIITKVNKVESHEYDKLALARRVCRTIAKDWTPIRVVTRSWPESGVQPLRYRRLALQTNARRAPT